MRETQPATVALRFSKRDRAWVDHEHTGQVQGCSVPSEPGWGADPVGPPECGSEDGVEGLQGSQSRTSAKGRKCVSWRH